jgi:Flp pilus assembly pilin Flp
MTGLVPVVVQFRKREDGPTAVEHAVMLARSSPYALALLRHGHQYEQNIQVGG